MNILIFGSSEFISSSILKRLKNNNKVYIILRNKIKIKWLSKKLTKVKTSSHNILKSWKLIKSNISDIVKIN